MEFTNPALRRWLEGLALRRDHTAPNAMFPPSAGGGGGARSATGSMVEVSVKGEFCVNFEVEFHWPTDVSRADM
jgi:hypothetical protein